MRKIISLFVFLPLLTFAWGKTGHRVVGQIAENHLSPKAAQAVRNLLGPDSLAEVANWADEIRSDPAWKSADPWHYVNIPDGQQYETMDKNPAGDIYTALKRFEATLRSADAPKEQRIQALKFLVHMIGDLHQPLHAGKREDLGGNRVSVHWFRSVEATNLHSVWDDLLIEQEKLSFTEWTRFLDHPTDAEIKEWQSTGYSEWMSESQKLRERCYDFKPELPLSYDYVYKSMPIVKQRLLQAGVRLAGTLNAIFP
ncbi:MAG TPA: S1/P1 nuclease [Bryobacteraceae bacterium]|nr:S1/P1 nuclease [Bryobacteraceae bacterium]